jgi:hypothetical protein
VRFAILTDIIPYLRDMATSDLLALLAIVIALSAYLATIRLFAIETIRKKDADGRRRIHRDLRKLLLADIPMTMSAVFLGVHALFWVPDWVLWVGLSLFVVAGSVLFVFHIFAWIRSLWFKCEPGHYMLIPLEAAAYHGWKTAFQKRESQHKATLKRVFCEGTTNVWMLFEPEDVDKAKAFVTSPEMHKVNTEAGLTSDPSVTYLTEQAYDSD